ncbi:MAG: CvpA family protein [Oscillospiraceae bacterium]|jgi:uncharacterized membrane protein required for colicin V production|nr:CvpA family protein [Oscillospiraceae bacterium]
MSLAIDLIIVAIMGLFIWKGWRKGLILGLSGVIALVVAFTGSSFIARNFSDELVPALAPFISGEVDKAIDSAQSKFDANPQGDAASSVSESAVAELGILGSTASKISEEVTKSVNEVGTRLKEAMEDRITSSLAYAVVLIVSFILILILFAIVANLVNFAFRLPGLSIINGVGGAVLGFVKGLLLCFVIAWAIGFLGIVIPSDILRGTVVLSWLMKTNPISAILGI